MHNSLFSTQPMMKHQTAVSQPDSHPQTETRPYWPGWVERLRGLGLDQAAAAVLDGAGPLGLILAQVVYLGQPFFGRQAGALAHLLENQCEAQAFAALLREEGDR